MRHLLMGLFEHVLRMKQKSCISPVQEPARTKTQQPFSSAFGSFPVSFLFIWTHPLPLSVGCVLMTASLCSMLAVSWILPKCFTHELI